MIGKFALAPLVAPVLLSAAPVPVMPDARIRLVSCGSSRGTAWQATPDTMVTALHVAAGGPCSIGGVAVALIWSDPARDLAALRSPGRPIAIACGGVASRADYHGIGYALGRYRMESRLVATGGLYDGGSIASLKGAALFRGGAIPGMSGGPMLDKAGRAVAIVNAGNPGGNLTIGRTLRESSCAGAEPERPRRRPRAGARRGRRQASSTESGSARIRSAPISPRPQARRRRSRPRQPGDRRRAAARRRARTATPAGGEGGVS